MFDTSYKYRDDVETRSVSWIVFYTPRGPTKRLMDRARHEKPVIEMPSNGGRENAIVGESFGQNDCRRSCTD